MTDEERWLPIPGFEGSYEVSDQGRVRSLDRSRGGPNGFGSIRGVVLRQVTGVGAMRVCLWRDGIQTTWTVHRLVLLAFAGPRPDGLECCHGNGDFTDNRLSNLRWDTHSANMQDQWRHGTNARSQRTTCPRGHLLVERNLRRSQIEIGRRQCLACHRAASEARAAGDAGCPFDFEARANELFEQAMAGVGPVAHKDRTRCPRGHLLAEPNIVPKKEGRSCWACAKARWAARYARKQGRTFDLEAAADDYYQKIMSPDPAVVAPDQGVDSTPDRTRRQNRA